MYQIMLGQPKYIFCFRFLCKYEVLSSFSCKSEVLSSLLWKFEVLSFSISFFYYGSYRNRSCREGEKKESFCARNSHLLVRLATSGFGGGRSPRPPLKLVVADFFIAAATNSVHAVGIGAVGKEKKRIFLYARFPPRGEAGNVKIWGGRFLRSPLELVISRFLIVVSRFFIPIPTH
jgi:hypothetical protein